MDRRKDSRTRGLPECLDLLCSQESLGASTTESLDLEVGEQAPLWPPRVWPICELARACALRAWHTPSHRHERAGPTDGALALVVPTQTAGGAKARALGGHTVLVRAWATGRQRRARAPPSEAHSAHRHRMGKSSARGGRVGHA